MELAHELALEALLRFEIAGVSSAPVARAASRERGAAPARRLFARLLWRKTKKPGTSRRARPATPRAEDAAKELSCCSLLVCCASTGESMGGGLDGGNELMRGIQGGGGDG